MLMVQSLYSENKLSRRLNSHLNTKYRYEVSRFRDYNEDQFMVVWQVSEKLLFVTATQYSPQISPDCICGPIE